jgi:ABC-type Fe3+-hydroxamate transport system substrate-binding protein
MRLFIDQMQREVWIPKHPQRIISLVPSQTELLFYLGMEKEIVGITKFCVHPKEKAKEKIKIGGTKKFKFDLIDQLQPDLIIGNKEENYQEGIEQLAQKYPLWLSDIYTFEDALEMIEQIGQIADKQVLSQALIESIQSAWSIQTSAKPKPKVAYFIWYQPWMVAGGNTFINEILRKAGFENVFGELNRYPEIKLEDLKTKEIDYIFLSSEPFPFKNTHCAEIQNFVPHAQVKLVDGEMFSWYGSRLLLAADYIQESKMRN